MKHLFVVALFAILVSAPLVWAHGNGSHVVGTVTTIEDDHVVVKTPKGDTASIAFKPETTFQRNGIHSQSARPQIGDRLAAEVTKKGVPANRDWVATELNFVTPKKP